MCDHSIVSMVNPTQLIGQCHDCKEYIQMAMTICNGKPWYFNPWPRNPRITTIDGKVLRHQLGDKYAGDGTPI
jgi:hypothetical protein